MPTTDRPSPTARRLRLALFVIATAQLMLVLDDTVANVALPSIQRDLGVSAAALPWVINAYVLAFGGLLLFGGRMGDVFGQRRVLRWGLGIFTVASLLNGLAPTGEVLLGARGLQGIGAALAAPNALALIATTFPAGKERNSAMAVYGAMSGLGIVGGVLLGGVLTDALGWRSIFLINIPIGIAVLFGTRWLAEATDRATGLDTTSAVTGTGGVLALAYGITRGGEHGWLDAVTLGAFAAAVALILLFVLRQARSAHPMLPLRLFADRNRSGAYATILFVGAGLMGTFYLLALYLQQVRGYSPLETGLAALPFAAGIILASGVAAKLAERLPPRQLAVPGLLLAAGGMFWLSQLGADTSYFSHILPAFFITSAGLALAFMPMTLTVVHEVDEREVGVASALANTAQQIGAAIGLAVLTTVSTAAAANRLPGGSDRLDEAVTGGDARVADAAREALTHGYTTAFIVAAGLLVLAAVLVALSVTTRQTQSVASTDDSLPVGSRA